MWDRLKHPPNDIIVRVEHLKFRFVFRATTLRGDGDLNLVTWNKFHVQDSWCVVLGVFSLAGRIRNHRGTERVAGVLVRASNPLVEELLQRSLGVYPYLRSDLHESDDNSGVLTERTVSLSRHA